MAAAAVAGRLRTFSALRHRDFRWFFLNIGVQSFGQGIQFLGIGWLIFDLTGEKTSLGLAVSIFGVSNFIFTFAGGVMADRMNRKLFLIFCVLSNGAVTLALAFLALAGLAQIWHVYVVVFIMGGLSAVQMPARFALAADLVPREDMMNAIALHTSIGQIGNMVGPLIGGWAIDNIGTWAGHHDQRSQLPGGNFLPVHGDLAASRDAAQLLPPSAIWSAGSPTPYERPWPPC